MLRPSRISLMILLAFLITQGITAGEAFLIDRETAAPAPPAPPAAILPAGADGRTICLVAEGRVWPYRWSPPVLESQDPFGLDIGWVAPVPFEAQTGLLLLHHDRQHFELWHQSDGSWTRAAGGDFGGRVAALAGGRFSSGEGPGLFIQLESGRIAYWQVNKEECLPIWQSPEPWPMIATARQADLDGDGFDELIQVGTSGAVSILRWRNGVWESVWTLPPWGQVLGLDLGQADDQPGSELVLVTSQRKLFLIGNAAGAYIIKARLTLEMVASHAALVPGLKGAVMLGDAVGNLYFYTPEADSWRLETRLRSSERLAFLAGLGAERAMAGTVSGGIRIFHLIPLGRLSVFYDGVEAKNTGLYWEDGDFYFGPELLQRVLNIATRWDEKKASLTLTWEKLTVVMQAEKAEAIINGRPWPIGRSIALVGKVPYVPADLLRSVFLINVTHDPVLDWLILTSYGAEAP
ncbi:MAG: stalk domain-containing protein [Bacteroidota bacterium]